METIRMKIKKIRGKGAMVKRHTKEVEVELYMDEIITECDIITRMIERIQTLQQCYKERIG